MNKKALGLVIGGGTLAALALVVRFGGGSGGGQSVTEGELDRYRTETTVTVADGDRTASGKVYTDCLVSYCRGWNTGGQLSTSPTGMDPFAVLADRSIVVLSDLRRCPESTPWSAPAIASTRRRHPRRS